MRSPPMYGATWRGVGLARVLAAAALAVPTFPTLPVWAQAPDELPLGVGAFDQWNAVGCSDGAHGAFMAWLDRRSGTSADLYIQRLDPQGAIAAMWPAGGLAVCDAPGDQLAPVLTPD